MCIINDKDFTLQSRLKNSLKKVIISRTPRDPFEKSYIKDFYRCKYKENKDDNKY